MKQNLSGISITELSPLDQIRLVESEVARQLVAVREAAQDRAVKARALAEQMIREAGVAGRKEGETEYKNITLNAQEEARTIIAQAHHRAQELKRRGRQRMPMLTLMTIQTVTGLEGDMPVNEP